MGSWGRALAALALAAAATSFATAAADAAARDLCLRGQREMESGRLSEALETLRQARAALGREAPVKDEVVDFLALSLHNLGVRFNNEGDVAKALDSFVEALALARSHPDMRDEAFREALERAAITVASRTAASGAPGRALEVFALVEAAGGDARHGGEIATGRARLLLADAAADTPHLRQAVEWLRRACALDPGSAQPRRDLSSALVRLSGAVGREGGVSEAAALSEQAETLLLEALRLEPASPWTRLDLAWLHQRARRYAQAAPLLVEAGDRLEALLAASPLSPDAPTWRRALAGCRENLAVSRYNLAVDAINRAQFDQVEPLLSRFCENDESWRLRCDGLRIASRAREEAFHRTVEAHEKALRADPARAADLLALGDLHANLGDYDRALGYYRRLEALGTEAASMRDRIAAVVDPGSPPERHRDIDLPGGRVKIQYYDDAVAADLEAALRAAWLRVGTSLGAASLEGPLLVTLHSNRRAFRERAGYRVGGIVKGYYAPGHVAFFETPSQTTVEWVSVLTHELAHHAIERLAGGAAPVWLSEGVARYVEGETAVADRDRLRRRLRSPGLAPLTELDQLADRSWNDVEIHLDVRDEALLAVEEMAARRGGEGLREILTSLRDPSLDLDAAIARALRVKLADIDEAWRARLTRDVSAAAP